MTVCPSFISRGHYLGHFQSITSQEIRSKTRHVAAFSATLIHNFIATHYDSKRSEDGIDLLLLVINTNRCVCVCIDHKHVWIQARHNAPIFNSINDRNTACFPCFHQSVNGPKRISRKNSLIWVLPWTKGCFFRKLYNEIKGLHKISVSTDKHKNRLFIEWITLSHYT